MGSAGDSAASASAYADAYAVQYSERNLGKALVLYREIVRAFATAPEAGYARTQIRNIAHSVVPESELLEAQIRLALACLERAEL